MLFQAATQVAQAAQQAAPVTVIDWTPIILALIVNLGTILGAMAVLVAVIKGNFKVLGDKVDGHFSKLIDVASNSKELAGKVDLMAASIVGNNAKETDNSRPPGTRRITDPTKPSS